MPAHTIDLGPGDMAQLAAQLPNNMPFCTSNAQGALAIVRKESSSDSTAEREAVERSRIVFIPNVATFPQYPILSLKFAVYANPSPVPDNIRRLGVVAISQGPLLSERIADIVSEHIQRFLEAVLENGGGSFSVYAGKANATECLAIGRFAMRCPPPSLREKAIERSFSFPDQTYPYRCSDSDRSMLWQMVSQAAAHYGSLSAPERSFDTAVEAYLTKSMGWS